MRGNMPERLLIERWRTITLPDGERVKAGNYDEEIAIDGARMADEFKAIEEGGDYMPFFERYALFDSSYIIDSPSPCFADYADVRDVLYLAFRLQELECTPGATLDDLLNIESGRFFRPCYDDETWDVWGVDLFFSLSGESYSRELARLIEAESRQVDILSAGSYEIPHALDSLRIWDYGGERVLYLFGEEEYFSQVEPCEYAGALCDLLYKTHLSRVATMRRGHYVQVMDSGLCALWLSYLHKTDGTRVATCQACGKPFLARDRGNIKKYCDTTCKEWAHKHPGQKRAMRVRR